MDDDDDYEESYIPDQDIFDVDPFVPFRYWALDKRECWIKLSAGDPIPRDAIEGGHLNADGEPWFIARADFKESLTPGKLSPEGCFICWGGAEHKMDTYEVLCGVKGSWVKTSDNNIPRNALRAGYAEHTLEILYLGRAEHNGMMVPGKVHPSHSVCYVPYNGEEVAHTEYEIFVFDDYVEFDPDEEEGGNEMDTE